MLCLASLTRQPGTAKPSKGGLLSPNSEDPHSCDLSEMSIHRTAVDNPNDR